jgi:tRNA threonylcarbamoyladenosine biosynthesis protein TsaE
MTLDLPDLAATEALAARLAAQARPGDAVLLSGPLGAGKSAFARAFLRAWAGDPGLEVPSPSFTLVQAYERADGGMAWHFDLYRLSGPEEVPELGWDEARLGIALVEWPERLGHLMPDHALALTLGHGASEDARVAHMNGWEDR